MNKYTRKQIKADYEDLQIKPSSDLWSRIETELDNSSSSVQSKNKLYWWKYAAVFLILISLGGIFYIDFDNNDEVFNTNKIVKKNQSKSQNLKEINKNLPVIKSNDFVDDFTNIHQTKATEIALKQGRNNQPENNNVKHISSENNIISRIENVQDNESESLAVNQEITDLPKVATSQNSEKVNSTKYITAHDLIFQRKYNVEEKQNQKQNTGRLGIIKIKKLDVTPEFISLFNTTNTSEQN